MELLLHVWLFMWLLPAHTVALTYRPSTCPADNSTCLVQINIWNCHTLNIRCKARDRQNFTCASFEECGIMSTILDQFLNNAQCFFTNETNHVLECKMYIKEICKKNETHKCGLTAESPILRTNSVTCHIYYKDSQCIQPSIPNGTDFSNCSVSCTENEARLHDNEHKETNATMIPVVAVLATVTVFALIICLWKSRKSCGSCSCNRGTHDPVPRRDLEPDADAPVDEQEL